ncbi:MAG: putative LPS assembly protein LptD, partial [Gemmatimonadales bacterium]
QSYDLNTTLNLNLNYASNTQIVSANASDPLLSTQQMSSDLNFQRRFAWGTVAIGGSRRQNLNDGSVTQTFPTLTVSPAPIQLSSRVTWSPALTFTQDRELGLRAAGIPLFGGAGGIDTIGAKINTRSTTMSFDTPLRIGDFTWRNSFSYTDQLSDQRQVFSFKAPNLSTLNPSDSQTVTEVANGTFSTGIDWQTGINLPLLLRGSWKVQPSVGIVNATSAGPFLIRNRNTGGQFVQQGKRFQFALSAAPTFFGFINQSLGPIARIRHSVQPIITYSYSPSAAVSDAYAKAIAQPGQVPKLISPATQLVSISLNQVFEAKGYPQPGDTSAEPVVKKYKLLSIATSAIGYDFEQAKLPHRTGWTTQSVTNAFQTDLLPGFSASLTHDLWNGPVGTDSARFDPFLTNVSLIFAVSGGTFRGLGRFFGLLGPDTARGSHAAAPPPPNYVAQSASQPRPGDFNSTSQFGGGTGGGFTANVNLTISRQRPSAFLNPLGGVAAGPATQENVGFSTSFSPTPFWNVSWTSMYNIALHRFESQNVRLQRNLHDWRAGFTFVQNVNGNFAFLFSIFLSDLPDIKFDYNQTTIQPTASQ